MQESPGNKNSQRERRPFIGIHFTCCNAYNRIYKNKEGTAYEGSCPRCGKLVRVPIGEGGTGERFFVAH
ncbi:MAG: hypothetical protein GF401_05720 [Chitinivibrionales bacterium]|nr:hypothetical protein [Chitinivibrionales bacterium]